jgi:hypothetical protein
VNLSAGVHRRFKTVKNWRPSIAISEDEETTEFIVGPEELLLNELNSVPVERSNLLRALGIDNLHMALLTSAINAICNPPGPFNNDSSLSADSLSQRLHHWRDHVRDYNSAVAWVTTTESDELISNEHLIFSFEFVCRSLGYDPASIRHRVIELSGSGLKFIESRVPHIRRSKVARSS